MGEEQMSEPDDAGCDASLASKVAAILGLDRVVIEALSPGTSRGAMRVLSTEGEAIAFVRADLGVASEVSVGKSLPHEIAIVRRAHALGFPVPRIFGMVAQPAAAVMELAPGTARPDVDEAERVGPDYMAHIARLHGIAPGEFGLDAPATLTEAIAVDLDTYEADALSRGILHNPVISLAFRLLRATLPRSDAAPSMLHGDVGAGNFMAHEGRISAILDWELAHAGDIHEDLAWLWVRGAHSAFGDPRTRIAEYEGASGVRLDPARLAWHVAFVTLKSVIGLRRRISAAGEDKGLLPIAIAALTYDVLLCIALARLVEVDAIGLEEAAVLHRSEEGRLIELVGLLEPHSLRESTILLRYLQDKADQRDWRDRRMREDCRKLLAIEADQLDAGIAHANADQLPLLLAIVAADAWRRCKALPNAERRVRRALEIGFGQERERDEA
ncbi:hypothetical protein BH10PSE13_BH10PSE13_18050 [soil metagenome]